MNNDAIVVKTLEQFLNEQEDINYLNLKKQYINGVEDLGNIIIIKTANFEITVSKDNIKQVKQFEEYPKVLEDNTFDFDGYQIRDRIIQKSPRIKEFNAYIYFPKLNNAVDYNTLSEICKNYADISYSRATFKPRDIYKMYSVKENVDGYIFTDNIKNQVLELKNGKIF